MLSLASGGFHHYDYGKNNMEHYGQDTPPEYDISKVTVPVSLYWSQGDWLAVPTVRIPNNLHL
jgi:lysosomal acid lipase/cholesteryl ester hydrolase